MYEKLVNKNSNYISYTSKQHIIIFDICQN